MSLTVSLIDVARVAKVAPSTASRVLNGKAGASRISPTTQARVSAAARQLGFKPDPQAVDAARGVRRVVTRVTPGADPGTSQRTEATGKTVVLMLSTASTTTTLALIPGLEAELVAANYQVTIIVVPADPVSIQNRVARLPPGMAGILVCTAVYQAVSAAVDGAYPVLVLWQGAAKAVMNSDFRPQTIDIRPRPVETVPDAVDTTIGTESPLAAIPRPTTVMPPPLVVTPVPTRVMPPVVAPRPVITETQTPAAPATVAETEPSPQQGPVTVSMPVVAEIQVSTPEPVAVVDAQEHTPPVVMPEPTPVVVVDVPTAVSNLAPTPVPVEVVLEPIVMPEPTVGNELETEPKAEANA